MWQEITEKDFGAMDKIANHPLQTSSWGLFREKTGVKVVRMGKFEKKKLVKTIQLTIHPIPRLPYTIGYYPKSVLPDRESIEQLKRIGEKHKCIFIQIEPDAPSSKENKTLMHGLGCTPSHHPLFPQHTLLLDLTPDEKALMENMHPKTRYNIKVAQRHGVEIVEDNSDEALHTFWTLMEETTKRQGFFAHSENYFKKMWETLSHEPHNDVLSAHLFKAMYEKKTLATWIIFLFKEKMYYPYGDSTREFRNVMAPNLMMWEVIRFGKKQHCELFDMWGSLGPDADPKDPWYGFHDFKVRYGSHIYTFVGSYDLVVSPFLYQLYRFADTFRYILLRVKK